MYAITLSARAEHALNKLDRAISRRVVKKLRRLAVESETMRHKALHGRWSGAYRIIYRLDHEQRIVLVEVIGHRRDIYDE